MHVAEIAIVGTQQTELPPLREARLVFPCLSGNRYETHKQVYALCALPGEHRNFIFSPQRTRIPTVVVRGRYLPDDIAVAAATLECPNTNTIHRFQVEVAIKVRGPDGKRRRMASTDVQRRASWLAWVGRNNGFELLAPPFTVVHSECISRKGTDFTCEVTTFEGLLRIVNAEKCAVALEHGIGRDRAFGLGMIRLQPFNLSH